MQEDTKFYEVVVTASVQMLVQAHDAEQALQIAIEEVDFDRASTVDSTVERELSNDKEVDQMERLADQIVYL